MSTPTLEVENTVEVENIIFARALVRKLDQTKKIKAEQYTRWALDDLESDARNISDNAVTGAYSTLNASYTSTTKEERDAAEKTITNHISQAKKFAALKHQQAIDRVALGLDFNDGLDQKINHDDTPVTKKEADSFNRDNDKSRYERDREKLAEYFTSVDAGLTSGMMNLLRNTTIDHAAIRKDLDLPEDMVITADIYKLYQRKSAMSAIFNQLWKKLELVPQENFEQTPPTSHAEFLQQLKAYYEHKRNAIYGKHKQKSIRDVVSYNWDKAKGLAKGLITGYKAVNGFEEAAEVTEQRLNDEYHALRNKYFNELKDVHDKIESANRFEDVEAAETEARKNIRKYGKMGLENRLLDNEIANKKIDQKLLTNGLRTAKLYALAQGVFVAGGFYFALSYVGAMAGFAALGWVGLAIGTILAPFTIRSNWITINEEMGPLLKELFYNPAHAHLTTWEKIKRYVRRTEISFKSSVRTVKGMANLVAGSFLGFLTFLGGLKLANIQLLGLTSKAETLKLVMNGAFIASPYGAIGVWFVMAALVVCAIATAFVYFVISNLNQVKQNHGTDGAEDDLKRHEQLRTIAGTSKLSFWKRYGINMLIGGIGIAGTMAAAGRPVFKLAINFLGFWPVLALTTLLISYAVYGILPFYKKRTRGSTEGLIVKDKGLDFGDLELEGKDVSGLDAPDFSDDHTKSYKWQKNPVMWAITSFFNMDKSRDNSRIARPTNAIGQGALGITGIASFIGGGLAWLFLGTQLATIIGLAGGAVMGLGFAFWASYSANSTKLRVVKEKVTELNVLERDKTVLENVLKNPPSNDLQVAAELGKAQADAQLAQESRQRQTADHYGFAFASTRTKVEKINDYQIMRGNIATFFDSPPATKPAGGYIGWAYTGKVDAAPRNNPLVDRNMIMPKSEISDIAQRVDNLMDPEKELKRLNSASMQAQP